jgi:hypothetical protein
MDFFTKGVDVLQKLVILIGAGLGVWGVVNLLEGYGNDNPGAKSQGMKQFMSGAGIVLIATLLVPSLKTYLAKLELSQKRASNFTRPSFIYKIHKSRAKDALLRTSERFLT